MFFYPMSRKEDKKVYNDIILRNIIVYKKYGKCDCLYREIGSLSEIVNIVYVNPKY